MTGTKRVPVVSWVSHVDMSVESEVSSGGFFWHFSMENALKAFEEEMVAQRGGDQITVIRLVLVDVPEELDGQELTDHLDQERLEEIEETGKPVQEVYVV